MMPQIAVIGALTFAPRPTNARTLRSAPPPNERLLMVAYRKSPTARQVSPAPQASLASAGRAGSLRDPTQATAAERAIRRDARDLHPLRNRDHRSQARTERRLVP